MIKEHAPNIQVTDDHKGLISKVLELQSQIVDYALSVQKEGEESYESLKKRIDESRFVSAEDKAKKKEYDGIFFNQVKCINSLNFMITILMEQADIPSLLPFY